MAEGVYNGMPAGELPGLRWRLATGGNSEGGVEMARIESLIGGAQDGDFDALLA